MSKTNKKKQLVPRKASDVKALQAHLKQLGYLNADEQADAEFVIPPDPEQDETTLLRISKSGTMDRSTTSALKQYQEFHGLKATGKLDKATLNLMGGKRCACPDHDDYSLDGRKWNKHNLTYGFKNYSPDLPRRDTEQAVAQAFAMWAAETPLSFRKISNSANPDIRIEFKRIDNPGNTLAYAYYPPPNGGDLAGDATFDEFEKWTIRLPITASKTDLVTVAAHEFGHSLGLKHSSVQKALMYPYYGGPRRYLDADDKNGIRRIYGGYSISHAPWVHGTSIQVEQPDRLSSITRAGFYTYITGKANTTNWFHFAIPSPVIVDKKRQRIVAAILRFRTFSDRAVVKHVHIHDGSSKIASHNDINLHGNQWFQKLGVAHKPHIYWGLGISIGVEFKSGNSRQRRMDFVSAGCDLIE